MNSEQQLSWRHHVVFDPMNAHSQADHPALTCVMQFNADERECQESSTVPAKSLAVVPAEHITSSIIVLRSHRVILDSDLATIYGVTTGRLNEAVKRNSERFPEDFMFQLTPAEYAALISQSARSKSGRGGRRKLPWVFTEHGAIQAANVLNSSLAVEMGIYVVRAFVKLRELLASNKELAQRLDELEARI